MKHKLTYEKVTEKNIEKALKIQRRLFPLENGEDDLKESINKSKKYYKYLEYYLVHNGEFYIGITGIYSYDEYPDDAWIDWFGVDARYRNNGIGTQMLLKILDIAKYYNKKNFRLFTYETWNYHALSIYKRTMQLEESYDNEKENSFLIKFGKPKIYSRSLIDKEVQPWNNKFINLSDELLLNEKSIEKLKEDNLFNLFSESDFMETLRVEEC